MTGTNIRAALAADPELGAGNVLHRLLAHGADPAGPGLTFDSEVDGHPAYEARKRVVEFLTQRLT